MEDSDHPFEVWDCDPSFADTAAFCEHYDVSPDHSANTILVKSKSGPQKFAVCVVLATHRLDVNHTIRKKLGTRKASFASAEETKEITGMEIGGVTPLALPDNLPVWIDSEVIDREYVILGGGNRISKLKVYPQSFDQLFDFEIVSGLGKQN